MAGQKFVAVLLIVCLVVAAVQVIEAEDDDVQKAYKKCLEDCEDKCNKDNKGYTFCEMKCDSDCGAQEFKANVDRLTNPDP